MYSKRLVVDWSQKYCATVDKTLNTWYSQPILEVDLGFPSDFMQWTKFLSKLERNRWGLDLSPFYTQAFWSSIARTHWFWCFSVPELASNGVYWSCNNLQIPLWPFSLGSFCTFLSAMNSTFRNQCKPAPKIGFGPTLTFRSHLRIYNSSWMILSWCPMILQSPSTGGMAELETGFQLCFLKEWSLATLWIPPKTDLEIGHSSHAPR